MGLPTDFEKNANFRENRLSVEFSAMMHHKDLLQCPNGAGFKLLLPPTYPRCPKGERILTLNKHRNTVFEIDKKTSFDPRSNLKCTEYPDIERPSI